MTDRWRPASGGGAAFEVRAGWRRAAPQPGIRLRLRLEKRAEHWTWTALSTDHISLYLPLINSSHADFYKVIFLRRKRHDKNCQYCVW